MKKLDKLILSSFLGPFILTLLVVIFILLTQFLLKYFEDLVGKDLGFQVFAELIGYFSINMTPDAFPLAVLLSSLITFGNLGEHFELTAIKGSGISLLRALRPIFLFVVILTIGAFFSNDLIVPRANLKAFSLLYDIKTTKASLNIPEGTFYNELPGFSMKINKKVGDGKSLKDIIIYDHSKNNGNTDIVIADSGRMYNIYNDRYLVLELFDGHSYSEVQPDAVAQETKTSANTDKFVRTEFEGSKYIFSLSSFNMQRTREELFSGNRLMKNINQLTNDIDSMALESHKLKYGLFYTFGNNFIYHLKGKLEVPDPLLDRVFPPSKALKDTTGEDRSVVIQNKVVKESAARNKIIGYTPAYSAEVKSLSDTAQVAKNDMQEYKLPKPKEYPDSLFAAIETAMAEKTKVEAIHRDAISQARYMKNNVGVQTQRHKNLQREIYVHENEIHKKYAKAFACIVMFLIGAPLGAIIKKGGLGIPVLISIIFFIFFYVVGMVGEKWSREGLIDPFIGIWVANFILLPIGFVFLIQARNDARLLESDFYSVLMERFKKRISKN